VILALLAVLIGAGPYWLGAEPPAPPRRIVTLAPSLTELVFSLGEGARVVGVTRYDDLAEAKQLPRVGGFNDPSAEAVLALEPDAIFTPPSPGNRGPVEALVRLGVPALVLPLDTVGDVLTATESVGRALGVAERAAALKARIEGARERARTQARGRTRAKVALLVGAEPLVAAGPKSYAGELLADAGAENVAKGEVPFPMLSAESLLTSAPGVILVAPGMGAALRVPGLRARVVTLPSDAVLRPGPRIVQALEELQRALASPP
jgi:iron complex transport system substrate-binding protein